MLNSVDDDMIKAREEEDEEDMDPDTIFKNKYIKKHASGESLHYQQYWEQERQKDEQKVCFNDWMEQRQSLDKKSEDD